MTTPGPPGRPDQRMYSSAPLNPLASPGSPPPAEWSEQPVADRLIHALERLVDLDEEAGHLTAIYRASLQHQTESRRGTGARLTTREDEHDRDAARRARELER